MLTINCFLGFLKDFSTSIVCINTDPKASSQKGKKSRRENVPFGSHVGQWGAAPKPDNLEFPQTCQMGAVSSRAHGRGREVCTQKTKSELEAAKNKKHHVF